MSKELFKDGTINILKLALNQPLKFKVDANTDDWVKILLMELNENATDKRPENWLPETTLEISGEVIKRFKKEEGEILLTTSNIDAHYVTECVKTLRTMKETISITVKACFLNKGLQDHELYQDIDDIYEESDVYQLYFYEKNTVDFKEMIHEQIFLNYNSYPTIEAQQQQHPGDDT